MPSFADTLANIRPEVSDTETSPTRSNDMLEQLRAQASYRSSDTSESQTSRDQVQERPELQPDGVRHSSQNSARRHSTPDSASTERNRRPDTAEQAQDRPEDEVHLTSSKSEREGAVSKVSLAVEGIPPPDAGDVETLNTDLDNGLTNDAAKAVSVGGESAMPPLKTVLDNGKGSGTVTPGASEATKAKDLPAPLATAGKTKSKASVPETDSDPEIDAVPTAAVPVPGDGTGTPASTPQPNSSPAAAALSTEMPTSGATNPILAKGKGSTSSLAFAVKISGSNASAASGKAKAAGSEASSLSAVANAAPQPDSQFAAALSNAQSKFGQKDPSDSGDGATPVKDSSPAVNPAVFSLAGTPDTSGPASPPNSTAMSSGAQVVTELADDKAASTQAVKNVQVQITNADNERVDLRLVERAGALTISVRSGDANLTRALQENLPALSNKLGEQQVRTEWWTPEAPRIEAPAKINQSNNDGRDASGNQNQGGQGNSQSGQQGGRDARRQPDWLDELSDTRGTNQNGAQYTWHL